MRTKFLFLLPLVIALLATGVAFAAPPIHRVTGGGIVVFPEGTEVYGFVAKVDEAGMVSGQGEFHFAFPVANFHAQMNCLEVDGNMAWLGLEVTQSNNPDELPVGLDLTFQVQDNGEGANDPPDLLSYFVPTEVLQQFGWPEGCNDRPPIFDFFGPVEWTHGNVQVK